MIKNFICPDGGLQPPKECLNKCRMPERCSSLDFLEICADESHSAPDQLTCTKGLRDYRELYLLVNCDYDIEPESRTYAVLGTRSHQRLEKDVVKNLYLGIDGITGRLDAYEVDTETIVDHKTWGSYKVAKTLGITIENKLIVRVPKDDWELRYQLNFYRIAMERKGYPVKKLKCEVFVRDGNLWIAKNRGIVKPKYFIDVPFEDDEKIIKFYTEKNRKFHEYLKNKELPPLCHDRYSWNGNKCKNYCDVRKQCPDNPYLRG